MQLVLMLQISRSTLSLGSNLCLWVLLFWVSLSFVFHLPQFFFPSKSPPQGDLSYYDGIKVNGIAPNKAQVAADPSLNPSDSNPQVIKANEIIDAFTGNKSWVKELATNVYKAHHDAWVAKSSTTQNVSGWASTLFLSHCFPPEF